MDWSALRWLRVVDLTHPLGPDTPTYPGDVPVELAPAEGDGERFASFVLRCSDHAGTHIDAPSHLGAGGQTVDRLRPEDLLLPGATVDVRDECRADPNYRVQVRDIEAWEAEHGWIAPGSIVLLQTGWSFRWADPAAYLQTDDAGMLQTPGLGGAAARFLVEERSVRAVGIDAPSVDVGRSSSYPAHVALLEAGCFVVENLNHLHLLPATNFRLLVAPLKLVGASGAPCRVLGLVQRD